MMSKQTAIIFILVVFLGALGALLWFYFSFNTVTPDSAIRFTSTDVYDPFEIKTKDDSSSSSTDIILDNTDTNTVSGKLRKISDDLISGFSIINNAKTGKIDVHYILRANGNIYETYADSEETKRLSATTIPKVYESVWLPDGERLIIRYLKDISENIETFSVKINPATTTLNEFAGGVDGNHLPENISTLAVNPKGDKLFYLENGVGGASGFVSKLDGLNKKVLFESPLTEWLASWPKEEIITLTTKASAKVPGYLFFLNSQTGSFSRILSGISGLTTKTNASTTAVLYSDSSRDNPRLYLYDVKKGESKLLPWNTLPEKCLWGNTDSKIVYCAVPKSWPAGDYPDSWYQGLVNFTDDIWQIDTETLAATLVIDLAAETENNIDVSEIQIDKTDSYLFFINKTDLSFWSLNLK